MLSQNRLVEEEKEKNYTIENAYYSHCDYDSAHHNLQKYNHHIKEGIKCNRPQEILGGANHG